MLLSELTAPIRRLALVGLAKNTGKTETLAAMLREHAAAGRPIAVTSIGRDGEERDVMDARIAKPRVHLAAGDLVASTGPLLRAGGASCERLLATGVRTPLGEVIVARLLAPGTVEVAGPSAAADVREVSDAMLALGAEQVLIDGAIDRRAASSPAVSDALVMVTGAVLAPDLEGVVAATAEAVALVRLPVAPDSEANAHIASPEGEPQAAASESGAQVERNLVLQADPQQIAAWLREHPQASRLAVEGALNEGFLEGLLAARAERAGRELRVVAGDPTRVFLSRHGTEWYGRQGIAIEVRRRIALQAITVNPVAPQSHRLDSERLRSLIAEAVPEVPVLDVLDPSYLALAA